jgi:uroporphyrin-III C-methyltransferase/precorrin-2 dehydrogenase/sirohydrochlorin ferrochelatase
MIDQPDARRRPDEAPNPRMPDLATLPVFFRLHGKRAIVIGGGDPAAWKAELLAAAGARVDVYALDYSTKMLRLAVDNDRVTLHDRAFVEADFADAAIAIADCETDDQAIAFHVAAKRAGIPVNVIDKPARSDFQFGAIVERSPIVIGISTDGAAPVFGQMLRARIETILPHGFRAWARAAKSWRPRVTDLHLDHGTRRRFWERFARLAFNQPEKPPAESDFKALFEQMGTMTSPSSRGSVALVGAGPGDPELLTLKAVRALQSADVVLFDDLILPGTLELARREATKLAVGKRGYKPSCTQEDICALMIQHANEGKRVVRLKGGDPMVFGRAGEEIAALRSAGVAVEVIPGITTASAAAASLQASLTERAVSRRVQFITAHARNGKLPMDLDWRALADPGATTVVYMGLKTIAPLAERLISEGLPPATPATLLERVSWPDEREIRGTIATIATLTEAAKPIGPCVVIIGGAMAKDLTPTL